MDSAEGYASDPVTGPGSNWQPHSIQLALNSLRGAGAYSQYGSQQIVPASNQIAPTPSLYPLTAGFGTPSPSAAVPTESLEQLKQTFQEIRKLPQMADPLSLMASLIAVATAGYQVADTLYKLADAIGNANEEILSIGKEIRAFSRVLDDLRDFLDDAKELISKNALENANVMVADCKYVFAKIERMLGFCNAGPRMNFWHALQWSFRREKVKPMCARLESFKSTLALLLMTLKLAKCKKDIVEGKSLNSSSKEQRYRASLETDIVNNSAAITHWQRVEVEARSCYGANPYSPQNGGSATPSKELQWLSSLVPFKPLQLQTAPPTILSLPPVPGAKDDLNQQAESQKAQVVKTVDVLLARWTTLDALDGRPKKPGQVKNDSLASHTGRGAMPRQREMKPRRKSMADDVGRRCADSEDPSDETTTKPLTDSESIDFKDCTDMLPSGNINDGPNAIQNGMLANAVKSAPTHTDAVDDSETDGLDVNEGSRESQMASSIGHLSENSGGKTVHSGDSNLDGDRDEPTRADEPVNIEMDHGEGMGAAQTESGHLQTPPGPSAVHFSLPPDLDWSPLESEWPEEEALPPAARPPASPPPESVDSCEEYWRGLPAPRPATGDVPPYGPSMYNPSQNNGPPYYGSHPPTYGQQPYGPPPTMGYAQTIYGPSSMNPPILGSGPVFPNAFYSVPYPQQPAPAPDPNNLRFNGGDQQMDNLKQNMKGTKQEQELERLVKNVENTLLDLKKAKQNHDDELAAAKRREQDSVGEESSDTRTIGFQDAVGRIFTFPYQKCKKWANMKRLIEQAFGDFEPLGERVRTSHYDLMDPSGAIILPSLWETLLEPYWTIKMVMWPYGEQPLPEEPRPQRPTVPRPMTTASEGDLPQQPPPPPVPMPPSAAPKPRFPSVPREKIVEETGDGCWRTETGSETRSMTTDESSDENSHKSTCQYRLSESFQRYGQQFEETWEAVMARSRLKAQKTILETWLSQSEAELRKLDPSPSRNQRTSDLGPKSTVTSEEISTEGNNDGTVSVPGQKSQEDQAGKALPQPDHECLVKQTLPCSLAPSHSRSLALCETCHSPLLLTSFSPQAPEIYRISSLRASGPEVEAVSPQHILPRSSLEQRFEMLEDLIRRQEADRQARLDKTNTAESEQRPSRLERAIVQADVQTPPFIPNPSETSPMLAIDGVSLQATPPRPRNGTASSASRSPFLRSLFGRSTSSSAKAA